MVKQIYPAIGDTVTVRVTLAADAEPGQRRTPRGNAAGHLQSDPLLRRPAARIPEAGDGRRPGSAGDCGPRPIPARSRRTSRCRPWSTGRSFPATRTRCGSSPTASRPATADRYRFEARKGQQLVIAAAARELIPYLADAVPGWFQATLALYDAKGREVAYDDDYRFHPDPVLFFKVPEDGQYVVEIKDAIYRGRPDFVYRITLGELPYITGIFPLGGPAGTATTVKLSGWNLPTDTLTMDAKDMTPGLHPLSVRKGDMISNTMPFSVDTLPECLEQEPNDSTQAAQAVTLPVIVNGRIDRPGDWDVFRFEGRAGQEIVAEVRARRLESPLDSVLELVRRRRQAAGLQRRPRRQVRRPENAPRRFADPLHPAGRWDVLRAPGRRPAPRRAGVCLSPAAERAAARFRAARGALVHQRDHLAAQSAGRVRPAQGRVQRRNRPAFQGRPLRACAERRRRSRKGRTRSA